MSTTIDILHADVLDTPCDVLVLKYADGFYGADALVAHRLGLHVSHFDVRPGLSKLVETKGKLPAPAVLFCGVGSLWEFGYSEIREFARRALTTIESLDCTSSTVAMTMHGTGYGLDEREAFTAQVAGLMEQLTANKGAARPKRIVIVEKEFERYKRLEAFLRQVMADTGFVRPIPEATVARPALPDAGTKSDQKKHVFVAMPYNAEMEDTYEFGIRQPINDAGCLCERCDHDVFTGDILDRIKHRISTATVVVADMTGSNPNVYLEVGFAWGKGVPTLLVAREGEDLKFDVKTQKCLYYRNITHLRRLLAEYIATLLTK